MGAVRNHLLTARAVLAQGLRVTADLAHHDLAPAVPCG